MGKKQSDYTISDVIRLNPTWLTSKQTSIPEFQQRRNALAGMMDYGFNYIGEYPFLSVFPTPDISALDMGEINKALHEYKEEASKKAYTPPRNGPKILEAIRDKKLLMDITSFKSALTSSQETAINRQHEVRRAKTNLQEAQERYRERVQLHEESLEIMERNQEQYESIKDKPQAIDNIKLETLKGIPDHWRIAEINTERNSFRVIRTKPVTLVRSNANSGINQTLNMGFVGLELGFRNLNELGRLFVGNNLLSGERWQEGLHPHFMGYICWGNISHLADKARQERDIPKYFELLDRLLETYDGGNPFRNFASLNRRKNSHRYQVNLMFAYKYPEIYQEMYLNSNDEKFKQAYEKFIKEPPTKQNYRRDDNGVQLRAAKKEGWYNG